MNSTIPLRILLADSHPIVLAGLAAVFAREADIQVVGQAASGQEVLALFSTLLPDVLVMEIALPDREGRELIATLTKCFPASCILVFSRHSDEETIHRALQAGADGYSIKEAEGKALVEAARTVYARHKAVAAHVSEQRAGRLQRPKLAGHGTEITSLEKRIRVLIADDYPAVREGLAAIINRQKDMQVCAEAVDGEEALDLFRLHQPDIALMDLQMPFLSGIKATRFICGEFPTASVVILTTFASEEEQNNALQAGAKACLFKDVAPDEIIKAIRTLHNATTTHEA